MEIYYSPRFRRSFKKLSKDLQARAWERISLFRETPFHPLLKSHKLSVDDLWAFSVDFKNRIVFRFLGDAQILLINIGDHSIYRKISFA